MKIAHLIQRSCPATDAHAGIDQIRERFRDTSFLVVLDSGSFAGILTPGDIIESPHQLAIDCLHRKPPLTFDQDIESALKAMKESRNSVLPVFRAGEFVGVVTQTTIVEYLSEYRTELEEAVCKRTCELKEAYEKLQQEMDMRRQAEEKLLKGQKFESLGILAAGVANAFNQLLTAILGNIYLARLNQKLDAEVFEILGRAEKAALRAANLTKQLLTFSNGGIPIKKTTSIAKLLRETATFVLRGSSVGCEFSIPDELWPVEVDAEQMGRVFYSLIINAYQATPEGGIIRLGARNMTIGTDDRLSLKEGRYVQIAIKDQGAGIAKEYLTRIFDPYFTTKEKGRGLKLAICYSIVKKHEGLIKVESEPGIGTTLYLYLPALEA